MKNRFRRLFSLVLLAGLLLILSCAPRFPEYSFIAEKPSFDLLISVNSSEFKDAIVSRLVNQYKETGNIDLVGIKTLKNLECEAYDAVLIMDSCKAWAFFNFSLKSFLKNSNHCKNIILYMSAGDPEWKYTYAGLDAVTSASVIDEQDRVVEALSEKIDRLIVASN